jgi:2-polyprenyl-3-methyl-5-hydroxy-6-metoxy-1,4-benzoquinol methylase
VTHSFEKYSDWRAISKNPVDQRVIRQRAEHTKILCNPFYGHPDKFLRQFVSGRSVLDIGCAEHDEIHWEKSSWQHAKLKQWASGILGLDILPDAVEALKSKGYSAICADATSEIDLERRFERIVVGDVLEHVERPVELIKFAIRHLTDDGLVVMRTPNPFWWKGFIRVMYKGVMIENAEHVSWITPCCAIELASRAGAEMHSYHPQMGRFSHWSPIYALLKACSGRYPEIFASSYLYVFSKKKNRNE